MLLIGLDGKGQKSLPRHLFALGLTVMTSSAGVCDHVQIGFCSVAVRCYLQIERGTFEGKCCDGIPEVRFTVHICSTRRERNADI